MRGDRPQQSSSGTSPISFTPHARGSTYYKKRNGYNPRVYPACAGIDLARQSTCTQGLGLPRMRGDRPPLCSLTTSIKSFTPHARGSTPGAGGSWRRGTVYPACAGIDRAAISTRLRYLSLPRMRGDRPSAKMRQNQVHKFTPHARGSTAVLTSSHAL